MTLERRIRQAEADLFTAVDTTADESFLELDRTGLRVRLLAHGHGQPIVLLHCVSLAAATWAPLFGHLSGYRSLAVELPGHGLSEPVTYRRGGVREHSRLLIEDILDALGLDRAPVVGHSLGGMLALWHTATQSNRIAALVAIGAPAVALPGVRVRMPLSVMTLRGLGPAALRSPSPRAVHRRLLARGLGSDEVAAAPGALVELLRQAGRRPENARTVASLMNAINRFRRPRPESVLTAGELDAITTPTLFIWGRDDPYLSPADARPAIAGMPSAALLEVPGGHAPWLIDPERTATQIRRHLTAPSS